MVELIPRDRVDCNIVKEEGEFICSESAKCNDKLSVRNLRSESLTCLPLLVSLQTSSSLTTVTATFAQKRFTTRYLSSARPEETKEMPRRHFDQIEILLSISLIVKNVLRHVQLFV